MSTPIAYTYHSAIIPSYRRYEMDYDEIAKEIVVAMVNKMSSPNVIHFDEKEASRLEYPKWIGDAYKTIYKAVSDAPKKVS